MPAANSLVTESDNVIVNFTAASGEDVTNGDRFYVDFFSFGDRVNNAIYRM